uniref:Hint domain-containing protein n=1 Tax=Panagrolaimus sp. ES5 TaxID=591445 RepID=A0AC34FM20_9BILA
MKKAKFQKAFDLSTDEEFKNGGDIYEKGKLIGFDYISNIIKFDNDDGKNYEIFVNRIFCNNNNGYSNSTISTTTLSTLEIKSESNDEQRQKLYQALIAEAENNVVPNNLNGDLQSINEAPATNAAAPGGGAGAGGTSGGCTSCSNVQILTQTAAGPDVPITQTTATDANGCSVITVSCSSGNPNSPLAFNVWQGQGADRGTTNGVGTITETLTCNNLGQLILNEPAAPGIVEQVSCTTQPSPPINNFQAPPQFIQQPFQPVQFVPQQAPAATGFSGASRAFLCFSGDTLVTTFENTKKRMDEIKVGEWIKSGDSTNGETGYSKVNSWIHRKPDFDAEFLKFSLENGQELKISKKHFIYKGDCKTVNTSNVNNYQMVYAENVTIHDCLFTINEKDEFIETRISKIEIIQEKGIYAPLTENGNLIVNDIFASCYSNSKAKPILKNLPSFTEKVKTIISSMGLHHLSSSSFSNEYDLIPGFKILVNILKNVVPNKF